MTAETALARVTQELSQLRYQVAHEADREPDTLDALALCRRQIVPEHCSFCRAASTLADTVLAARSVSDDDTEYKLSNSAE